MVSEFGVEDKHADPPSAVPNIFSVSGSASFLDTQDVVPQFIKQNPNNSAEKLAVSKHIRKEREYPSRTASTLKVVSFWIIKLRWPKSQ